MPPPDAAKFSAPEGSTVVPKEDALVLMEGVVKGGYPVDMSSQSTADLTSIGQSECGCTSALIESGLEPAAAAQLEAGYTVLDTQESYTSELDFPSSITEVIRPMEMAELVDILPTLTLIEEEIPTGPSIPTVMDMLESFGLGIDESNTAFDFESSNLMSGDAGLSQPSQEYINSSSVSETRCESMVLQEEVAASHTTVNAADGDGPVSDRQFPREDSETQEAPSKESRFPLRGQVEWDRPCNNSS